MVNGTLSSFLVLINLASGSGLQSHPKATGDDIFFTNSNGNEIPHEIESFTSRTGTLVA